MKYVTLNSDAPLRPLPPAPGINSTWDTGEDLGFRNYLHMYSSNWKVFQGYMYPIVTNGQEKKGGATAIVITREEARVSML